MADAQVEKIRHRGCNAGGEAAERAGRPGAPVEGANRAPHPALAGAAPMDGDPYPAVQQEEHGEQDQGRDRHRAHPLTGCLRAAPSR